MTRFRFVESEQTTHRVNRLCQLAGVSRTAFYRWRQHIPSQRALADEQLMVEIREIHTASRGTYGTPRVHGQLRRRGLVVNRKRVERLMRVNNLCGVSNRRRWRRNDSGLVPGEDLVARDFTAKEPDRRWVADITEFACGDGRLYLAGIMDLYSRRIVGWSIGDRRPAGLVVDALVMTLERRRPAGGVIHHADHGAQYTSMALCDAAHDAGVVLSFGTVGSCYDNAAMEAFWSTLKRELAHIHSTRRWQTRAELRAALFDYIEVFYNRQRHQARLGHLTPADYEAAAAA